MALNIKNALADRLARRSAELRETGITEAVTAALQRDVNELERARETEIKRRLAAIRRLQDELAAMPVLDPRSPQEIMAELDDDILASH